MKPQSGEFVAKARFLIDEADVVLALGMNELAGRNAYLSAFHVAQATIFEHGDKIARTHAGVQNEFQRITKDDPRVDRELRKFLSQAYNLKAVADYETGPQAILTPERAATAVSVARRFVEHFSGLLDEQPSD